MRYIPVFISFAMATLLSWPSQGQDADLLLDKLKHGIEENEKKLLNVRVDGTCYAERLNETTRQWELALDDSVTAWYEGVPRGKRRIEHHKTVSSWKNGAAPFLEEAFNVAYNGRNTQTLWTRSGPLKNPSSRLHGDIVGGMDWAFMGEFATGWRYSLYGAFEESGRLSTVFRLRRNMLRAQEVKFNGVACIKFEVVLPNGVPVTVCYFDPARGYALLEYERGRGDGVVVEKRLIDSLVEPAPEVYYPSKARTERMTDAGTVRERESYEASAVVANDPSFSDDLFTIKWPPKTRVRDLIATNTFVVPEAGQPERPVSEKTQDRVPLAVSPARPDGGRSRVWAVVVGVGIVAVLVIVPISCLRRKK
jgi:hypothetical protein